MAITHPTHPAKIIDGKCNALLWNCKGVDNEGNACDYHFVNAEETDCPLCGTMRRRCTNNPLVGKESCKFHGGRALSGTAHPNYQGKGFSTNMPTRLMEQVRLSINDPDLLNLTDDIAIVEAREAELIQRLRDHDYGTGVWDDLVKLLDKFDKSRKKASNPRLSQNTRESAAMDMNDTYKEIQQLVTNSWLIDQKLWDELHNVQNQKVKLIGVEMKRREKAQEIITAEQFKSLLGYIINSINTRVSDPDVRMAIIADIQKVNG